MELKQIKDIGLTEDVAVNSIAISVENYIQDPDSAISVCAISVNGNDNVICCDIGELSFDKSAFVTSADLSSKLKTTDLGSRLKQDTVFQYINEYVLRNGVTLEQAQQYILQALDEATDGQYSLMSVDDIEDILRGLFNNKFIGIDEVSNLKQDYPMATGISKYLADLAVQYYPKADYDTNKEQIMLSVEYVLQLLQNIQDAASNKLTTDDLRKCGTKTKYDLLNELVLSLEEQVEDAS